MAVQYHRISLHVPVSVGLGLGMKLHVMETIDDMLTSLVKFLPSFIVYTMPTVSIDIPIMRKP